MRAALLLAPCTGIALAFAGALLPDALASDRPSTARRHKALPPARIDVPVAETGYDDPSALVDLRDDMSAALVSAVWRFADAKPVKVSGHAVGPDLRASGALVDTLDIAPKAGAKDFDDSTFTAIKAGTLDARRGNGKLSFAWYRLHLTLPERLGDTPVRGARIDAPFEEALDGLEVDLAGNLYVSGPGGVWILTARGEHLGTLEVAELPPNFAWGDDGKTLYVTARTSLYKLRTRIGGKLP